MNGKISKFLPYSMACRTVQLLLPILKKISQIITQQRLWLTIAMTLDQTMKGKLSDCSTIHRIAPMEGTIGKRGDKAPYETRRRSVLVGQGFYSCQKKLKYVRYQSSTRVLFYFKSKTRIRKSFLPREIGVIQW